MKRSTAWKRLFFLAMADYSVVIAARAERHLQDIGLANADRYSKMQRLGYIQELRSVIRSLDFWPKRYAQVMIDGHAYRRVTHKAHLIFYTVDDAARVVTVEAILHGHMDYERQLTGR